MQDDEGMHDEGSPEGDGERSERNRRDFLSKAGRFAAVTPPAVILMLSGVGEARAQLAASGATATATSTTTATATTTATLTVSPTSTLTVGPTLTLSDVRLKADIVELARLHGGLGVYRYRYRWGGPERVGVMAQELLDVLPGAVHRRGGYYAVDYAAVLADAAIAGELSRRGLELRP